MEDFEQDRTQRADDHLHTYAVSVAKMADSFDRVSREQRLLADEWARVLASLRSLATAGGR